jgi:hypothetical protein
MKLANDVYSLAESFMNDAEHVSLNKEKIKILSQEIKRSSIPNVAPPDITDRFKLIMLELVSSSINYCYWYGKSTIRPLDSNSTKMYETVVNAFYDFDDVYDNKEFSYCIDRLCKMLCHERFPLLEERIKHLNELKKDGLEFCHEIENSYFIINLQDKNLEYFFNLLISSFPGFASDMFLKRASLFFQQLNRRFGIMKNEMNQLFVPADYQIPKMLNFLGCLEYSEDLQNAIETDQLLPKHSLPECEIRSATILAIKNICFLTNLNVSQVDSYLFLRRHLCDNKFHLTITTDY